MSQHPRGSATSGTQTSGAGTRRLISPGSLLEKLPGRRRAWLGGAIAVLLLVALAARGPIANAADLDADAHPQALAGSPCHGSTTPPRHYRHVIWLWMENHSFHQVIGSEDAPFENSLARACGLASHYRAVAHPSLPNYLAAAAGSTFGVHRDRLPSSEPITAPTIFDAVTRSGRQWRTYDESMPGNCQPTGRYGFARNPAVYFQGSRQMCARWDVPMGTVHHGPLASALAHDRLPAFSLMVPNMCHSTHACPVASGDTWLSHWVDRIVTSPAYREGSTALFLTWDEGKDDIGQHVATIVVSPSTTPGTRSGSHFNHYSLLRTTADLLGVTPPGRAATAPSMQAAFGL